MRNYTATLIAAIALSFSTASVADKPAKPVAKSGSAVLWTDPGDLSTRDLFYGNGGKEHEPKPPFTFVKEDLDGTNPKFDVKDAAGTKWKVKMGLEVRPETTATRLVWAAGYYTTWDYYLPRIQISDMPDRLHRGQKLVGADGTVQNVRLKREPEGAKKAGTWRWKDGPFTATREWNGLRALMALLNNWDLKDVNNAILHQGSQDIYLVTDLGATFGSDGRSWPRDRAKDNLESYRNSEFIHNINDGTVDFACPGRPNFEYWVNPKEYLSRVHLEWIGKNVPRADAKWLGELLGRLTTSQIHDAFRAGGYSPDEIDTFTLFVKKRITSLTDL